MTHPAKLTDDSGNCESWDCSVLRRCAMTKKNIGPRQEPEKDFEQAELSETWRELLGKSMSVQGQSKTNAYSNDSVLGTDSASRKTESDKDHAHYEDQADSDPGEAGNEKAIPTLKSDPWSSLIQAKGVEIVDLHKTRLPISDQEVERLLKVMEEYPAQDKDDEDADPS